jgi:hypothetical protein
MFARFIIVLFVAIVVQTSSAAEPNINPSTQAVDIITSIVQQDQIFGNNDCLINISTTFGFNHSLLRSREQLQRRTQSISLMNTEVDPDEDEFLNMPLKYWVYGAAKISLLLCICMLRLCCIFYCPCSSRRRLKKKNTNQSKEPTALPSAFADDNQANQNGNSMSPEIVEHHMKVKTDRTNVNQDVIYEENTITKPWSSLPLWMMKHSETTK